MYLMSRDNYPKKDPPAYTQERPLRYTGPLVCAVSGVPHVSESALTVHPTEAWLSWQYPSGAPLRGMVRVFPTVYAYTQ